MLFIPTQLFGNSTAQNQLVPCTFNVLLANSPDGTTTDVLSSDYRAGGLWLPHMQQHIAEHLQGSAGWSAGHQGSTPLSDGLLPGASTAGWAPGAAYGVHLPLAPPILGPSPIDAAERKRQATVAALPAGRSLQAGKRQCPTYKGINSRSSVDESFAAEDGKNISIQAFNGERVVKSGKLLNLVRTHSRLVMKYLPLHEAVMHPDGNGYVVPKGAQQAALHARSIAMKDFLDVALRQHTGSASYVKGRVEDQLTARMQADVLADPGCAQRFHLPVPSARGAGSTAQRKSFIASGGKQVRGSGHTPEAAAVARDLGMMRVGVAPKSPLGWYLEDAATQNTFTSLCLEHEELIKLARKQEQLEKCIAAARKIRPGPPAADIPHRTMLAAGGSGAYGVIGSGNAVHGGAGNVVSGSSGGTVNTSMVGLCAASPALVAHCAANPGAFDVWLKRCIDTKIFSSDLELLQPEGSWSSRQIARQPDQAKCNFLMQCLDGAVLVALAHSKCTAVSDQFLLKDVQQAWDDLADLDDRCVGGGTGISDCVYGVHVVLSSRPEICNGLSKSRSPRRN